MKHMLPFSSKVLKNIDTINHANQLTLVAYESKDFFSIRKSVHICKALNISFKKIAVSSSSPNLLSRAHAF